MKKKPSNSNSLEETLRKSWYRLRLSVRSPSRVPTWDAIVLTAASPEQAALYEWQLKKALRMGRVADSTVTLAVPDPDGKRIGSGAATLNAIRALANHYNQVDPRVLDQLEKGEGSILTPAGGHLEAASLTSGRGKAVYISPPPYLVEDGIGYR
ncbi:hypothetical protein Tco_0913296 [Tanacetum coccineum]